MADRPIKVAVIGGGRHARLLAQAVLAVGGQVAAVAATPEPRAYGWDARNRKRAQWKDETSKRGRNR